MAKLLRNPADYPEITTDDVCLIPNNPVAQRIMEVASEEDKKLLEDASVHIDSDTRRYHTLLWDLADKYETGAPVSRDEVDLKPNGSLAETSILIANMNAVTGRRMAEGIAQVGGLATIPQDKTDDEICDISGYLRSSHALYERPVKISPKTKVHEFGRLVNKRAHGIAIVEENGKLLGVVSKDDISKAASSESEIGRYIKTNIVTGRDGITARQAIDTMEAAHVNYLPIKNNGEVIGVLSKVYAAMRLRYKANIDPNFGGLRAAFTIGALNKNPLDRARLFLDLGIYDIQYDTAHADQGTRVYRNVEKTIDMAINKGIDPAKLNIIVGNFVTREAVRSAMMAGAKYAKGGIGPGNACTTRQVAGVGRPQLSMILECADEAHKHGGYLIADGGVRPSRDVSIDLAAGADYVMIGSMFAGTYESPPDIQYDENGKPFKVNFGMASVRASNNRTFGQSRTSDMDLFRDVIGHRGEGISEQRVYMQPGRDSVALLHHYYMDGVSSGVTYAGARSVREYPHKAIMTIQMPSGYREGEAKAKL